jgi:hypothetical protein
MILPDGVRIHMNPVAIIKAFIHKARMEAQRDYQVKPVTREGRDPTLTGQETDIPQGWIGMDLDGTLASSEAMATMSTIGPPIPEMMTLLKQLILEGIRVKIFTARAAIPGQIPLIHAWLKENGLPSLEITNVKDFDMIRFYDDRAVQVIPNTGEIVESAKENKK